ncbi:MAG: biotin/lipoyl-binding protein, partial [Nevskiales bacterium]
MSAQENTEAAPAKRSRTPLLVLAVVAIVAAGIGIYFYVTGLGHVTTDDAYVDGNLVRLTPQIGGTVTAINADETQFVQQGQLLVQLDPRDNEVALAQARASLGETVREVAQLFANEHRDAATVSAQQVQFTQAGQDLARDQSLVEAHGISAETLQHDQHTLASARANLEQA